MATSTQFWRKLRDSSQLPRSKLTRHGAQNAKTGLEYQATQLRSKLRGMDPKRESTGIERKAKVASRSLFTKHALCKECVRLPLYATRLFEGSAEGGRGAKCKEWPEIAHANPSRNDNRRPRARQGFSRRNGNGPPAGIFQEGKARRSRSCAALDDVATRVARIGGDEDAA